MKTDNIVSLRGGFRTTEEVLEDFVRFLQDDEIELDGVMVLYKFKDNQGRDKGHLDWTQPMGAIEHSMLLMYIQHQLQRNMDSVLT